MSKSTTNSCKEEKVVEIDIKLKEGSKFDRAPVPMAQHNVRDVIISQ